MKKFTCMFLAVVFLAAGSSSKLLGQVTSKIVGTVVDAQGSPVAGVRVIAKDPSGKVIAEAVANAEGQYTLEGLPPGQYNLVLEPANTGFQGETVAASLAEEGLTVNWVVSTGAPAVAFASSGIATAGLFGLGPTATGMLGFLFLGGTMFGLGMGISNGPASPSQ